MRPLLPAPVRLQSASGAWGMEAGYRQTSAQSSSGHASSLSHRGGGIGGCGIEMLSWEVRFAVCRDKLREMTGGVAEDRKVSGRRTYPVWRSGAGANAQVRLPAAHRDVLEANQLEVVDHDAVCDPPSGVRILLHRLHTHLLVTGFLLAHTLA